MNMDEPRNTLVQQQKHPRVRRKNATMVDSFLKQTFANSFLTFVESQKPIFQKPTLKESQEMIQVYYKKLHNIIDSVDQHLARRLQNHERQVFSIVKGEIEQMRCETQQIVEKLNKAIEQKNIEQEIWNLSNELDYFKSQTYKLFQENKKFREEIKRLQRRLRQNQIELENSDKLMQKLKYASMKTKLNQNKASQNVQKLSQASHAQQKSNTSSQKRKHSQTDYSQLGHNKLKEQEITVQLPKQSIVNIRTSFKAGEAKQFADSDEVDPLSHDFSFQSSSIYRTGSQNGLPRVSFIKVISQISQQLISNDQKSTKDKSVQTEPFILTVQSLTYQSTPKNVYSKTTPIDQAFDKNKQRQINFVKNGFFVRTFNESRGSKNNTGLALSSSKKESQNIRYINNTFNNNKISNSLDQKKRGKTLFS